MDSPTDSLPAHIDESVRAISDLHAEHYRQATPMQRLLHRGVEMLGNPALIPILTLATGGWIVVNLGLGWTGGRPIDPPPFQWLQCVASVAAVYMTVLILTTQRREDELAKHRDQLTLELAIVNERKSAKIIELLEQMRRDNPLVEDRIDWDAEDMAKPADPSAVLDAIKEVQKLSSARKAE